MKIQTHEQYLAKQAQLTAKRAKKVRTSDWYLQRGSKPRHEDRYCTLPAFRAPVAEEVKYEDRTTLLWSKPKR